MGERTEDGIVFDLDPDDSVPWAHLVEGATAIHRALDDLGLIPTLRRYVQQIRAEKDRANDLLTAILPTPIVACGPVTPVA